MKTTPAKGHTRKHTGTRKHTATSKHHPVHHPKAATAHGHQVHTVAKHPKHAKARGLALADGVACCAAEALAASLRLAGALVHDDDVLELHEAAACCHDAGAAILVTLQAAALGGIAGIAPASFRPVQFADLGFCNPTGESADPAPGFAPMVIPAAGLILGLELPGPHAVTVDDRGRWWSWGRPWPPSAFPAAVIEEAWAVRWG